MSNLHISAANRAAGNKYHFDARATRAVGVALDVIARGYPRIAMIILMWHLFFRLEDEWSIAHPSSSSSSQSFVDTTRIYTP